MPFRCVASVASTVPSMLNLLSLKDTRNSLSPPGGWKLVTSSKSTSREKFTVLVLREMSVSVPARLSTRMSAFNPRFAGIGHPLLKVLVKPCKSREHRETRRRAADCANESEVSVDRTRHLDPLRLDGGCNLGKRDQVNPHRVIHAVLDLPVERRGRAADRYDVHVPGAAIGRQRPVIHVRAVSRGREGGQDLQDYPMPEPAR